MDAWAYWSVNQPDVYVVPLSGFGAFAYSPPAALVADTFDAVPWNTFIWFWTALLVGTAIFLGGGGLADPGRLRLPAGRARPALREHPPAARGRGRPRVPLSLDVDVRPPHEVHDGRRTPLVRRPAGWRELAIAVVPAAVICAISYVFVPQLWADWVDFLLNSPQVVDEAGSIPIPLWLRMAVAVVVVVWGARTDRRWTVIMAATLSAAGPLDRGARDAGRIHAGASSTEQGRGPVGRRHGDPTAS